MQPRKLMHLHPNPIERSPHPPLLRCLFLASLCLVVHANTTLDISKHAMIEVELQDARAMHVLCGLLIGKRHIAGKLTDVNHTEESPGIMSRTSTQPRNSEDDKELTQHRPRNWFYGITILETGDPSRNVIEMIFRATVKTDITRCIKNIKQVLKLNHSMETLEIFESFREGVKNRAHEPYNIHPRNMVDGNEQLLFYSTKLTCCKQFGTSKLCSNLCRDSNCSICSIIRSGFCNAEISKTGIWLSTSCQDLINLNTSAKMMNVKMAILVCRVITGRVIDIRDRDVEGDYDSVGGVKSSNYLYVRNPSAVLPCFVIILNCT